MNYEEYKKKGTLEGVPFYGNKEQMNAQPEGVYLAMWHGYKDLDSRNEADDWGADGPMIGPLKYVHTTYASDIKIEFLEFPDPSRAELYKLKTNDDLIISPEGDCLMFGGMEYGDWTVFYHKPEKV